MTFREYQRDAARTDQIAGAELKNLLVPLLGLAGETGSLLTEYKKWLREGDSYRPFTDQVSEEIGDILWYLSNLATKLNLDLQEIADENLAKTAQRWPATGSSQPALFVPVPHRYDAKFSANEQLPTETALTSSRRRHLRASSSLSVETECRWVIPSQTIPTLTTATATMTSSI